MQAFDDRSAGVMAATLLVDRRRHADGDDGAVAWRGSAPCVTGDCRSSSGSRVRFALDVEFTCDPGDVLAIFGPSGSGKTTILRTIAGLYQPCAGVGALGRGDMDGYGHRRSSRRHIAARSGSSSRNTRSFRT